MFIAVIFNMDFQSKNFFSLALIVLLLVSCAKKPIVYSSADAGDIDNTVKDDEATVPISSEMNEIAFKVYELVNEIRLENDVPVLQILETCVMAAQYHAEDMQRHAYFSHDGRDETWLERMERFELTKPSVAENIALGGSKPELIVGMWMKSDNHRANILNPKSKMTGVGYKEGYYVQCFSGKSP